MIVGLPLPLAEPVPLTGPLTGTEPPAGPEIADVPVETLFESHPTRVSANVTPVAMDTFLRCLSFMVFSAGPEC